MSDIKLTIPVEVENQKLYIEGVNSGNNPRVIADSENYLYMKFSFSGEWVEPGYALFRHGGNGVVEVELDGGGCYVPREVIKSPGFFVSAYCKSGDTLITTEAKMIHVGASGYAADPVPPPENTDKDNIFMEIGKF